MTKNEKLVALATPKYPRNAPTPSLYQENKTRLSWPLKVKADDTTGNLKAH